MMPQSTGPNAKKFFSANRRILFWYAALIFVVAVFIIRLFYLQIIKHDYYHDKALADQLKEYVVAAPRGIIEAHDGDNTVPIVLDQTLYTLYADPSFAAKDAASDAQKLGAITGGSAASYEKLIKTPNLRYVILAKRLSESQKAAVSALKLPGVGLQAQTYRTYPQGSLASQVLGFVNDSGQGEYGIEQALNRELSGKPGQLKAITDANGVPLAASNSNVETSPTPGNNVVLSLNLGMQEQMEKILQQEYQKTHSQGLSAIIMDPNSGQIKAMANYPTYNPADYQDVANPALFQNAAADNAIEPGSTMKTLTTSAALDQGVITPNETFYDPAHWMVDGFNITDIEEDGGARQQNIASLLNLSLNTGATWELMQMSNPGGTSINQKGINAWHDYMVNHFRLGQETGIEQGYESKGLVPSNDPSKPARALTYANTAFGQGVQVTALQLGAALSSVLNGGTYYQPTLIDQTVAPNGTTTVNKPKALVKNVVSPKVGQELVPLMQYVVQQHLLEGFSYMNFPSSYLVGGKTGTAQVAEPGHAYSSKEFNGSYVGFVGGSTKPQYVIVVYNIKPNVSGYAGSMGGQPVFADLAHMLINDFDVTPKN